MATVQLEVLAALPPIAVTSSPASAGRYLFGEEIARGGMPTSTRCVAGMTSSHLSLR
jgi:hypothetical protein